MKRIYLLMAVCLFTTAIVTQSFAQSKDAPAKEKQKRRPPPPPPPEEKEDATNMPSVKELKENMNNMDRLNPNKRTEEEANTSDSDKIAIEAYRSYKIGARASFEIRRMDNDARIFEIPAGKYLAITSVYIAPLSEDASGIVIAFGPNKSEHTSPNEGYRYFARSHSPEPLFYTTGNGAPLLIAKPGDFLNFENMDQSSSPVEVRVRGYLIANLNQ